MQMSEQSIKVGKKFRFIVGAEKKVFVAFKTDTQFDAKQDWNV